MANRITFDQFFQELKPFISPNNRLLVAISGGMDSAALLHLTFQLQRDYNIYAVHVNHGLRVTSDSEEQFVSELCDSLNISLSVHRAEGPKQKGESMEMWARRIRQSAFKSAQKEFNCDWVLTAHHGNDNVETILMHLLDGCGIEGLRGIPKQNGKILRPLLNFSRNSISMYVHKNGLEYVEDESNADKSIRRNHIRHELVKPWEVQAPELIIRFNELAQKTTDAVQRMNEAICLSAEKIKSVNKFSDYTVVATGGLSNLFKNSVKNIDVIVDDLTLIGLVKLYLNNKN